MKRVLGVYTLILGIPEDLSIRIGSLGVIKFPTGLYVYTGSALGAGGLDARISRHLRREKKAFWHIDRLTNGWRVGVLAFVKAEARRRMECRVNRAILSKLGAKPLPGFGSSDCRASCLGHLLGLEDKRLSTCLEGIREAYCETGLDPVDGVP